MKLLGREIAAICGMTIVHTMSATAQNLSYGANNFYRSDAVTVQPITFPTHYRTEVAGNLFIRKNLSLVDAPAIVVGHPMGAVKEQAANLYATLLAEQGFVTVSLDLPHWGASEGEPRNAVNLDLYTDAFSAAVDYLGTRQFVDRERIGAFGICGGGGFVISAAKIDPRMKAIATVSMYDMGTAVRSGIRGGQSQEQRKQLIAEAAQQRWVEAEGGDIAYTAGAPQEITPETDPIGREFYEFYRTSRGEFTPESSFPNLTTHSTHSSYTKFINFYPFNDIETISPRPTLFISGDQSHSREFSEGAYKLAGEPKELFWVPGAGHVDLYDRIELIPLDKITQFFRKNLAGKTGSTK
jgi:fermentation-respiration switch protein FrsA (DUF1100 family)